MVLLQHKLNVKLSQRQILTPGLVQMVSVLALNKLELKDMINAEMVENPVLEELEDAVPILDDIGRQEEERDRIAAKATTEENPITATEKKDPFEEIDFGSFFQDYLDPGYRSSGEMEEIERPSFENFLSKPGTLTDHLLWQLGAIPTRPPVREAAELIIGNLNEDGYLIASDDELLGVVPAAAPESDAETQAKIVGQAEALGIAAAPKGAQGPKEFPPPPEQDLTNARMPDYRSPGSGFSGNGETAHPLAEAAEVESSAEPAAENPAYDLPSGAAGQAPEPGASSNGGPPAATAAAPTRIPVNFSLADLHEALEVVRQFDPPGVACRDLRECLLYQLRYHLQQLQHHHNGGVPGKPGVGLLGSNGGVPGKPGVGLLGSNGGVPGKPGVGLLGSNGGVPGKPDVGLLGSNGATEQVVHDAIAVVDQHLKAITLKQFKEIARAIGRPVEAVQAAVDYIRTLDPRPGLQYNKTAPRLIEPDVAFVKHGDEWLITMNDEDMPQLRLNPAYKRLLAREGNDRETRNYVKDRYKSAIQLIKNIEQRRQTITKVCYSIVARQQEFLERGIDFLKPMMIKEVAEEIGVHPSTVSRAVANKYVHTPQGVFELRYFFSESVQGPEGSGTSLLILKRRVKKLIEDEDPTRPLTDEQITRILQSQGIDVTRRTVAKYREDMKIPSTHQRRVKK